MEIRTEPRADHLLLSPAGEMTIYEAANIKSAFAEALEAGRDIEVDLSEISEIDTSGVQLLMLLKRESTAKGRRLVLARHSPAVLEVFTLLGLCGWFGDPQLIPAQAAQGSPS